ncbi:MAG: hypothetical protein LBV69_00055 [Bacteroidales bacterium]|jgi:uncharacterized protein VirK/YbjX|nr:hypothetical protein [Bacteroidales bacterium]
MKKLFEFLRENNVCEYIENKFDSDFGKLFFHTQTFNFLKELKAKGKIEEMIKIVEQMNEKDRKTFCNVYFNNNFVSKTIETNFAIFNFKKDKKIININVDAERCVNVISFNQNIKLTALRPCAVKIFENRIGLIDITKNQFVCNILK